MNSTKGNILITGATGQQGGATATKLLESGWRVRAFTRDASGNSAKNLEKIGAEIIEGDMDDSASLQSAMAGCYGVFSVQPPSWNPTVQSDRMEESRGKRIADVALKTGIKHLVYSSVLGANLMEDFRPGFKYGIEKHIWEIGIPATILRPSAFMENILLPQMGIREGAIYDPTLPNIPVNYIAVEDIGTFVKIVFDNPEEFTGKTIDLAGDRLTIPQIANAISTSLGVDVKHIQVPIDTIKAHNPILGMLMEFLNKNGYPNVDLNALRKIHPGLLRFDQWIQRSGKHRLQELIRP